MTITAYDSDDVARSLPERTVDSWVTAEITAVFPHALIWSPTQRLPDNWDMGAEFGDGKLWIFENKGADPPSVRSIGHKVWIDTHQVDTYVREVNPRVEVLYVLPNPPWPDGPTGSRYVPNEATFRDTCATWLHVVPAVGVQARLAGHRGMRWVDSDGIPGWPGSSPLGAFLDDVRECRYGELIKSRVARSQPPPSDLDRPTTLRKPTLRSALAVFVPVGDLVPSA